MLIGSWTRVSLFTRIWSGDTEMDGSVRDSALQMGNVGSSWNFHPRVPNKNRDTKHPILVHCWRIGVLHRQNHTLHCWDDFHRLGWGEKMGWHHQAWVRQHWPHFPQQQAHRDWCWLPRWALVRPSWLGKRFARQDQGVENKGDQEWEIGYVGCDGCLVPSHLHWHWPHWQPLCPPCWSRTCHHFCCKY